MAWRQAIIWANAGILLIEPLGTNLGEISIEIHTFSFKKIHLKIMSAKMRYFFLGLSVLALYMLNLFREYIKDIFAFSIISRHEMTSVDDRTQDSGRTQAEFIQHEYIQYYYSSGIHKYVNIG